MKLEEFNYNLPKELIAQEPAEPRDSCRLMMVDKKTGEWEHHHFRDILDEIREGDVFVFNNTKVIPARLYGKKKDTGGKVEMLLLTPKGNDTWEVLVNPGRKALPGVEIEFAENCYCKVLDKTEFGGRLVEFHYDGNFDSLLDQIGEMPHRIFTKNLATMMSTRLCTRSIRVQRLLRRQAFISPRSLWKK